MGREAGSSIRAAAAEGEGIAVTRAAPKRGGGRPVATLAHVVADLARVTAGERPAWCAETTWQTLRIAAGFARTDLRAEVAAVGNDAAAVAVGVNRSTLRGWRGRWLR